MARLRYNFVGGLIEDNPLTAAATTLTSAGLAALPAVASPDTVAIVLDPDGINGAPEVAHITAHTSGASSATIARGREGTSGREHVRDIEWVHSATKADFPPGLATVRYTGGSLSLNSTAWANVPSVPTITLPAQEGDVIEATINAVTDNVNVNLSLDVATAPGGTITNNFGGTNGVSAWRVANAIFQPVAGSTFRTLVAADISGGTVTLQLRYKTDTASARGIFAGTDVPFVWAAKNLGPAS